MQTKKTFMQRLLQKNRDLVSENETLKRRIGELSESYQGQIKSLQSAIDEANAQGPVASRRKDFMGNYVYRNESILGNEPLYARPIPAQQSVDRQAIIDVLVGSGNLSEGVTADLIISAIGAQPQHTVLIGRDEWRSEAQQSPAVAVPDAVRVLNRAAEGIENQIANAGLRNDLYDAGYLRAIKRELINLRDILSSQSPRITEQDARRIINKFMFFVFETGAEPGSIDSFIEKEGRDLLNKLNGAKS